jgi:WD40 repeat protein
MLATGGYDGTLMLWDLANPARPQPYGPPSPGHGDMVLSIAFSSSGNYLASGSKNGTAIV